MCKVFADTLYWIGDDAIEPLDAVLRLCDVLGHDKDVPLFTRLQWQVIIG